ncbi:unnamed protein product [Urochloa decumbens]|uniref:Uncharacterized protein n=1 Tax=Urochloa decumbens TaxID=240449 RepID=A0ABC9F4W1_9POAL
MVSTGGFVGGHDDGNGADDGLVLDFRGNPADKSRTGGWLAAALITGTELAERVAVMGVATNLVTYLAGPLHLSNAKSANIVTNFMGTLNLLAFLGGSLADAKLGRYLTVVSSATISTMGLSLLAASTAIPSMRPPPCTPGAASSECVAASGGQMALMYVALYTIAAGAGGLKATVSGLGTDQFDGRDPREGRAEVFFFSRFYFWISLGSLFATTVLVYVQDNVGRGWGYGVSAAVMVAATAVFVAGTSRYRYRRPQGSPLAVIGRVLWAAWRNRKLPCPADPSELRGFHKAKVPHTDRLRFLDKAAIIVDANLASEQPTVPAGPTLTEVEEVKMVAKLLPIWSTCILFWTVYSQMNTFTIEQATRMDRHIGGGGFVVPAGSMPVFLFLAILLFTSLNQHLVVPLARRVTGRRREGMTSLQRVGLGLVLSTLSMAVSALVEKKRRDASSGAGAVIISGFWLVPQLFLVGASEAFGYVGQLEFFIREAPERMKSMSTGLFLTTLSMGFYLSSALVGAVGAATGGAWVRDNLDEGRLDLFYWMLAVFGVLNFVVFLWFSSRHEYNKREAPAAAATAAVELTGGQQEDDDEEAVKVAVAVNMIDV